MKLFGRRSALQAAAESPETEAARWLARSKLGLLRRDEEAAFKRWREDPRNEAALSALHATFDRVQSASADPVIGRMRAESLARPARGPLLLGNVPAGVAAAVLAIFFVGALVWFGRDTGMTITAADVTTAEIYATGKGERRSVALADGSVLELNTETRIQVLLTEQKRSVRLLGGQAMFDVAKHKDRPFVVLAGPLEVTALGTKFDVRIDRASATIVLVEGRVMVEPLARRGLARVLPLLDRHYLDAGEQLVANDEYHVNVAAADIEQSTSWQYGRLIFRGEPLRDAVAEFNRYSERQLTIADERLASLPVSGVFSVAHPENFLAAVSEFYPVRIEERSARLSVLSLREQ